MLTRIARAIAGSKTGRHLIGKLANEPWFQPIAELMLHRVPVGISTLAECGLAPDVVCDVGAYVGEWTRMALPYFPSARFVLVEAQKDKEAHLRLLAAAAPRRISHQICLLGASEHEDVPFFLAETGSSTYAENTSFKPQSTVTLPMRTLDGLLQGETGRIFLKLDVQGAELDVLSGAERVLGLTDAVLLEVSIVEYNVGAPRLAQVVRFLAERGFLAFDIVDMRRIGPILAQVDLIFVKGASTIANRAQEHIRGYGA